MNYPYSIPPYIQSAMTQAMQAIMSGGPLPPNCFIVTVPMQQAQQMLPQLMMNYGFGSGGSSPMMAPPQQPSYYNQLYQPQLNPYQYPSQALPPPSTAPVPYSNIYTPGYNYPVVPYVDYNNINNRSNKKTRRGKRNPYEPHSNVYNSSSFDSDMENLSWSRLFGTHHHRHYSKQQNQDPSAINYNNKSKQRTRSDSFTSTTSSSSTTTDETIRRVNVSAKQTTAQTTSSSSSKQQTKSSLPFKYSSEFVPGTGKQQQKQQKAQKSTRKEPKVRSDDVFVVKKSPPAPSSSQQPPPPQQ